MWTRRHLLEGAIAAGGLLLARGARATPLTTTTGALFGRTGPRARTVALVVPPRHTQVGDVFKVRRTIPGEGFDQVDPFLMLDHFDFTLAPGELGGLAPHPHRGFETVTVLIDGAIEHGDSLGNRGRIGAGDIQWMTAGNGIVHEENPADDLRARGGRVLGVQLWVNLPSAQKKVAPKYQDTTHDRIPVHEEARVRARVFAGEAHGVRAVIRTHTPMALVDYALQPGAATVVAYPEGWTAFVQAVDGTVTVGDTAVGVGHLALTRRDGNTIVLKNDSSRPARALLGGGLPIGEPFASRGPFVMSTEEELSESFELYRSGRMGRVANPTYDRVRRR
ncbi:MAG: pirin family protein [Deltaproteobacteria bacterium]|nr:pirin family protein [Deltaproteobacteria bacterium]